jgi:hypothetical protein
LKPEKEETPKITKGNKRKTTYNKGQISRKATNLGIKSEVKNQLDNILVQANNSSKKVLKTSGSAILKSIKSGIEETGENNSAFKAVDDVIKTADTAVAVEKGITATVNSGIYVTKAGVHTINAIKNAPKNISVAKRQFKQKIRKVQKLKRMKKATQTKLLKKSASKAVKALATATKGFMLKVVALFLAIVIIIISICGAVVAAIGSFLWQTSSDLDTTQIIKYLSELDYSQQNTWFSKGKTNVEIEKQNDNPNRSYSYHYLLAVDVPGDTTPIADIEDGDVNCMVRIGTSASGKQLKPTYKGFNKEFSSSDEMIETYRWTTDDYRAALAYIQVENENLGWFATLVSFVGEQKLKNSASKLHKLTYKHNIVVKETEPAKDNKYSYQSPIFSTTYSNDDSNDYYYFGRKYSVKYLIDNDMVQFSTDAAKNKSMKERFEYIYKYGNFAVGNLSFPLELNADETISDRIVKHFGKQLVLKYEPPEPSDDTDKDVYGKVKKNTAYHYANDLSADAGDVIFAPIGGLCKASQRENRGYEYTICTSYNGNNFDYTKDGYLVKYPVHRHLIYRRQLPRL